MRKLYLGAGVGLTGGLGVAVVVGWFVEVDLELIWLAVSVVGCGPTGLVRCKGDFAVFNLTRCTRNSRLLVRPSVSSAYTKAFSPRSFVIT